eukprot:TRINITY_DN7204_c0_g1_i4.p1 TRINITY_DN7204_c0_g1~~TRINITY_DN7204_c0_g1_i4.p1  ORF type:complete len:188 (-),score=24.91 TRINITY_DN7204_c0_g1_i4:424-987(-)
MADELVLTTDLTITYVAIVTMASSAVYLGSHMSLKLLDEKDKDDSEVLNSSDTWKIPVFASAFLFGMYLVFKTFKKEYVNAVLMAYILLFAIMSVFNTFRPIFKKYLSSIDSAEKEFNFSVPLMESPLQFGVSTVDILLTILCVLNTLWYTATEHWISNNIFGYCFAIQAISNLDMGKYKTGSFLLV